MAEILPFSGVSCDDKEKKCKLWWLATIKGKTCTVEVKIPFSDLVPEELKDIKGHHLRLIELKLEDDFRNSTANTQGTCDTE